MGPARYFGAKVGSCLIAKWASAPDDQIIGQAELLPVAVAKAVWAGQLSDAFVIAFVDNDSARHALIAGASPVAESAEIVALSGALDSALSIRQWVCRVPIAANVADGPSRLVFDLVHTLPDAQQDVIFSYGRVWPGGGSFRSWSCLASRLSEMGVMGREHA